MNKKTVYATIEARMNATRLPGKMAKELCPGLPALGAVIERLKACRRLDGVIVATTDAKDDDRLVSIAGDFGALYFRGSQADVLGRVVGAGETAGADILVLVTGDCSCVSPSLIDEGVEFFIKNRYDLVTNCLTAGYPAGIDLQVAKFASLKKAHVMAQREPYRSDPNNFEHTNFFLKNHPDIFSVYNYPVPDGYRFPELQLALDTPEDLEVIRAIYQKLYPLDRSFDLDSILDLLKREPGILEPLKSLKIDRLGYRV